jgi:hypothetical protein
MLKAVVDDATSSLRQCYQAGSTMLPTRVTVKDFATSSWDLLHTHICFATLVLSKCCDVFFVFNQRFGLTGYFVGPNLFCYNKTNAEVPFCFSKKNCRCGENRHMQTCYNSTNISLKQNIFCFNEVFAGLGASW